MDEAVNNQKTNDTSQPVPTVGAVNKERELSSPVVERSEPVVQPEAQTEGFVQNSQAPVPHVPEVGLTASAEETPVKTEATGAVSLPMSEAEAQAELKKGNSSLNLHEIKEGEYTEDSKPFFAALMEKIYQKMRILIRRPA
ncbi:MAG TPA: hypothetical protein VES68_01060 [Candidatus Sulfotelmatobacter sp.]|nr:hypothetical protein [Candidatus Sulfotelmatobacter sp.]